MKGSTARVCLRRFSLFVSPSFIRSLIFFRLSGIDSQKVGFCPPLIEAPLASPLKFWGFMLVLSRGRFSEFFLRALETLKGSSVSAREPQLHHVSSVFLCPHTLSSVGNLPRRHTHTHTRTHTDTHTHTHLHDYTCPAFLFSSSDLFLHSEPGKTNSTCISVGLYTLLSM